MRRQRTQLREMAAPNTASYQLLGQALQRYFCQYLINQRHLSPRTVAAYRDTFRLLLAFIEKRRGRKADDLCVQHLDASCVLAFLDHLERTRRNGVRTRNARLAAIRSFLRHAAAFDPLLLQVAQRVLAIPSKRFERTTVRHMTRRQVEALLDAPDTTTRAGLRDLVLLTLMYNTGARVSEIAALKVSDLRLDTGGSVHIPGKGRKHRTVPLWRESVRLVHRWLRQTDSSPEAPLLPNLRGEHMTRSGVEHRLRVLVDRAAAQDASLKEMRISPHTPGRATGLRTSGPGRRGACLERPSTGLAPGTGTVAVLGSSDLGRRVRQRSRCSGHGDATAGHGSRYAGCWSRRVGRAGCSCRNRAASGQPTRAGAHT
jgi:integrase/recombinase XerD